MTTDGVFKHTWVAETSPSVWNRLKSFEQPIEEINLPGGPGGRRMPTHRHNLCRWSGF